MKRESATSKLNAARLSIARVVFATSLILGCACAGCRVAAERPRTPPPETPVRAPRAANWQGENFVGPFQLRETLTFYVVNETGADFTVRLRYLCPRQISMDQPVLVRVFDPDENLIARHDDPGEKTDAPALPQSLDLQVQATGVGVYQVAITAFAGSVDIATVPNLPWGVFGYPVLVGRGSQFENAFVHLPPKLDSMTVRCEGDVASLALVDAEGNERLKATGASARSVALPAAHNDVVWRLNARSAKPEGEYTLNFGGMPIILCPDEKTARAIRASVDVLDDGTICFHKFQVRAHALLQRFRAMPSSAFGVTPPIMVRHKALWLSEPIRNQLLAANFGVFATLPEAMAEQNLDPRSPWFGTVLVWRDDQGRVRSDNPWTTYTRGGLVQVGEYAGIFAAVHNINAPFNPLYKNESLRNRVIIAALQDLMMLREHEDPHTEFPHHQGGNRAFRFPRFTQTFALVGRDCPEDVRQVWTDGLRRYVDAQTITCVCNTVNQWSSIWLGLENFHQGTGEQLYRDVLKRHLRWLATRNQWGLGFNPAGYFDEAEGPDATYTGITTFHLALIYENSKDPQILELLRQPIALLNHTIAPEPNGHMLGASSFCHRTPGDWTSPQLGGGLVMLADDLPEAAVHAGRAWMFAKPARTPTETQAAQRELENSLRFIEQHAFRASHIGPARIAYGDSFMHPIWERYPKTILDGDWPTRASDRFTRNFGDQFLCVRRPSYYAFIYAGHTMGDWQKQWRAEDPRTQHPRNGGGLCMFWSPAFGSSILAKNWSAYAAHTLIVEHSQSRGTAVPRAGGKVGGDWEDYWSIKNEFDPNKSAATISGAIRNQPLRFEKHYEFLDDRVRCELTLSAEQAAQYTNVWECFPYPLDKPEQVRVRLLDENGQPVNKRPATAIVFETSAPPNEVHLIVFDQPRVCEFGPDYGIDAYNTRREHGRVLAALPNQWQAGQSRSFGWSIMAVPRNKVQQAIRQTVVNQRQ